jgi:hypothetical protein
MNLLTASFSPVFINALNKHTNQNGTSNYQTAFRAALRIVWRTAEMLRSELLCLFQSRSLFLHSSAQGKALQSDDLPVHTLELLSSALRPVRPTKQRRLLNSNLFLSCAKEDGNPISQCLTWQFWKCRHDSTRGNRLHNSSYILTSLYATLQKNLRDRLTFFIQTTCMWISR